MPAYLPFILVGLAVFTAGCIAYIAWELSSGNPQPEDSESEQESAD